MKEFFKFDMCLEKNDATSLVGEEILKSNLKLKTMNRLTLFLSWLSKSSKDPQKIALTVKGLIGFLVMLGIANAADADNVQNAIVDIVILSGQMLTAGITAWGFFRKIYLTFKE